MFKTIPIIVMAVLCINFSIKAQSQKTLPLPIKQAILGKIISATTGEVLPGAIIKVTTVNHTVVSTNKGEFILTLSNGAYNLTVSHIGYKTKNLSIQIPLKEQLVISLETDDNPLNEVQIIGYGQTTKRLNTGSVSSISAKDIERQPVTNVLSALSGRMAGVFVETTNGLPGGNINIQIRGKGSLLAGTDPLYIVDGVPYEGTSVGKGNIDAVNITGAVSPLNNINPADIETINILKDADATSIYGSRGANGVVIITTKKGKAEATRLNLNIQQGLSAITARPNLLNLPGYLQMRREAFANDNLVPSFDPLSPNYAPELTLWSQTEGTDWVDYIFGNSASSTDLQARISGGKANNTFSANGNFRKEGTILPGNNNYLRGGLTSQFQHISEKQNFSIGIINQLSKQHNELSNIVNNVDRSFLIAPNYPLYLPDKTLNWYAFNILAEANARSKTNTDNNITNLNLSYKLLPLLNLKVNSGYTKSIYDQTFIFPSSALSPSTTNNTNFSRSASQSFIIEPQIDYSIKFKKSSLSLLVGGTYQNRNNERKSIIASNFTLESLMENPGSAGTIGSTSSDTQYKYISVFGRATYNLMESYILNLTLRRDGSSRFGPGNRYGNFGSIGTAWIISNLPLIKNHLSFLSFSKIRASYGATGNDQITDYGYLSTYSSPGSNIYQGISVIRPSRISNADFRWETTNKLDIGLELGLFKDAISISADYYLNRSKDQLVNYAIPQISGFTSYQANLPAVVQNTGLEISISSANFTKGKFSWSTSFNLTIPKNTLKSFENFESSSYAVTYQIGYDISRMRGYQSLGIDPNTGKVQYAGENGEISTTPYSNYTLGKQTPDFYGGLGNNMTFGNFEFSLFVQFVKQISRGGLNRNPGGGGILNDFDLSRWSAENPASSIPKASTQFDSYYRQSSINIFDTSYLRLKNATLSYQFSSKILEKMGLSMLKAYAEGQNLYTLWNRESAVMDPESGAISTTSGRNIPPLKTFALGLQLTL